MHCSNCGAEIKEDAKICTNCGASQGLEENISFRIKRGIMQSLSIKRQYIVAAIIQLAALTLFFIAIQIMLDIEKVVLNPIPYFIAVWALICGINAAVLIVFVFKGEPPQDNINVEKEGE